MPSATELIESDESVSFGTCGPIVVMVWTGIATRERLERAAELVVMHAARGGPVGILSVVEHGAPIPPPEVVALATDRILAGAPELAGSAFVIEGGGEWAMSALDVASTAHRRHHDVLVRKYCHDTREASAWLTARCGGAPTRAELIAAVELVRAALLR
ncbi:hypothetical protein [Sandaracinus amylolyticus]|uniref:hypothetical protein n=1 Tax=Sandaracinus amylolyticus TaxID=927083 RepID=UPI001F1E8F3E|nr:hypothetical protein [Sandaracinus amylolyticus]UJR84059.1 Hypothetical protein I5071_61300 [Sandaracinus amylolyticus]